MLDSDIPDEINRVDGQHRFAKQVNSIEVFVLKIKDDDFYTCADLDLINAAKTVSLRLLVIGKPRSGKTLLSKNLAARLDLVHISIENWLASLQKKIKDYVPPEDIPEGEAPPKFLTDLEEAVNKSLLAGSGPNDD